MINLNVTRFKDLHNMPATDLWLGCLTKKNIVNPKYQMIVMGFNFQRSFPENLYISCQENHLIIRVLDPGHIASLKGEGHTHPAFGVSLPLMFLSKFACALLPVHPGILSAKQTKWRRHCPPGRTSFDCPVLWRKVKRIEALKWRS